MSIRWEVVGSRTATINSVELELKLRPRAVLLRLLLDPNRIVSIDGLADFLWADNPPKTQRNSIARFVADLRRGLGPYGDRIETAVGGYRVVVQAGELDRDVVLAALSNARRLSEIDVEEAHDHIVAATDLVRAHPNKWLFELPNPEPTLVPLAELQLQVLKTLAELKLRTSRHAELVATLQHGLESHPFHEELWGQLMVALHRSGRSAEALRAGQRLRSHLANVGLQPGSAFSGIESRILLGSPAGPGQDGFKAQAEPLGRASDLDSLGAVMAEHRFVTVTGLGGSGKSELISAMCGDEELNAIAVYRVDLRWVRDSARVVPAVATAVGVPASLPVATPEELAQHLARVSGLLVLDNAEHLRSECAALADTVLAAAGGLRLLVGSREPLRAAGEYVYRLSMLKTLASGGQPSPSPAAASLIAQAASLADVGDLEPRLLESIEAICEALGGHPMAVQLAAGLLSLSTAQDLQAQLKGSTAARAPAAILDLAWQLLDPGQQRVLARLSVFAGGCTPTAAAAVASEGEPVGDDLAALVAHGLLKITPEGRLLLDATIREFAAARLSDRRETSAMRDRLTDWLRELTASWGIAELGAFAEPVTVLLPERSNLIEALLHLAGENRSEEIAWFAVRSYGLWTNHGQSAEIFRWLGPLVDDISVPRAARSAVAAALVEANLTIGDFGSMASMSEKSIELADGGVYDWTPNAAGFLALWSLVVPMELTTEEFLDMAETTAVETESSAVNGAMALMRRAHIAHHRRHYDDAVDYFGKALALIDHPGRLLLALETGEAISLYLAGRNSEALDSVAAWRSQAFTDEWHYQVDVVRAVIVGGCGEPEAATSALSEALRRHQPIAVWARADEFQIAFGLLADMRGESKLGAELLATSLSGSPFLLSIVVEHIVASRQLGANGFHDVSLELQARNLPATPYRGTARTHSELISWWVSGGIGASEQR